MHHHRMNTGEKEWEAQRSTAVRGSKSSPPRKTLEVHRCTPESSYQIYERGLPLFLGFLFRCHSILLRNSLRFIPPALLAERVFNLMYRVTELSCQVESDH